VRVWWWVALYTEVCALIVLAAWSGSEGILYVGQATPPMLTLEYLGAG